MVCKDDNPTTDRVTQIIMAHFKLEIFINIKVLSIFPDDPFSVIKFSRQYRCVLHILLVTLMLHAEILKCNKPHQCHITQTTN